MRVTPIDQGGPRFPLPEDYDGLSIGGQRRARVNACRQWLVPWRSVEERVRAYVAGIRLFDAYYLWPDHDIGFDPGFYDEDPLPTPLGHEDMWGLWAVSKTSITIAPRGIAKSANCRKADMFEMVSCPRWSIIYATNTDDNAEAHGSAIRGQYQHNDRLADDWGPECAEGRLSPKKGQAKFSADWMQLMNGSWIRCISMESRLRGGRPKVFDLDDPENDEKASTSMETMRTNMRRLLFNKALPMVMRRRAKIRWTATFVSRRHYAWHAMQVDGQGNAVDPRFNHWDRLHIDSEYVDAAGKRCSCWPEMWPATVAEKLEMAKEDPSIVEAESLEEIEDRLGTAVYMSEYRGKPGSADDLFFPTLTEEKHGYWFEQVDPLLQTDPWTSESLLCYWTEETPGRAAVRRVPISTLLRETRRFIVVDTSYTARADSDSKVAGLMAVTSRNELFVLDLWSGKSDQPTLILETLLMADRWRASTVHPEAIREGIAVMHELEAAVFSRAREMFGDVKHLPAIRKFNPGMMAKSAKISMLLPRFQHGLIKLPLRRAQEHPWRRLFEQIAGFNPDAADGGLQNDDEIDVVSGSGFVVRSRVAEIVPKEVEAQVTPLEHIAAGNLRDEMGMPYAFRLDLTKVTAAQLLEAIAERQEAGGRSRV